MRPIFFLAVVLLWVWPASGADPVYKWVDEQGKVHYSSEPPRQGAVKTESIPVPPPPSPEDVRRAQEQTEKLKRRVQELEQDRKAREAERAARETAAEPAVGRGPVFVPGATTTTDLPPGELRPGELPPGQVPFEPVPPAITIPR